MLQYNHILVATDISEENRKIAERALAFANQGKTKMTLLKVLEHLPEDIPADVAPPEGVDKISWMIEHAAESLKAFADVCGLAGADCLVETGPLKRLVVDIAADRGVDLIIVGAHERHGMALLHGSPTDKIVRHAPCDVLTVHLG